MEVHLKKGMVSPDGRLTIVDEDRLCFLVLSHSRGSSGVRTISKELFAEFVEYVGKHPDAAPEDARAALKGRSRVDKFEYDYCSMLVAMARWELGK